MIMYDNIIINMSLLLMANTHVDSDSASTSQQALSHSLQPAESSQREASPPESVDDELGM